MLYDERKTKLMNKQMTKWMNEKHQYQDDERTVEGPVDVDFCSVFSLEDILYPTLKP